jgi:hypothetical protein
MAFVKQTGKGFGVFQGNTGERLSTHSSRKVAEDRVAALHKEHDPMRSNRGKAAAKKFT